MAAVPLTASCTHRLERRAAHERKHMGIGACTRATLHMVRMHMHVMCIFYLHRLQTVAHGTCTCTCPCTCPCACTCIGSKFWRASLTVVHDPPRRVRCINAASMRTRAAIPSTSGGVRGSTHLPPHTRSKPRREERHEMGARWAYVPGECVSVGNTHGSWRPLASRTTPSPPKVAVVWARPIVETGFTCATCT